MTLAHALIIALTASVILAAFQLFGIIDLYLLGYNVCSWIGYLVLSVFVAWCFNKQPGIIKLCIAIMIVVSLLVLYAALAEAAPNAIPYINTFGIGLFFSFVISVGYASFFAKKTSNEKSQKSHLDEPQYLIQAIYNGRYVSRNDLFRFYMNYTSKKDTFIDLLNVICDVCRESMNSEELAPKIKERCKKVYSIVKPILDEEKEIEYLMNVTGKERDSLLSLHKFSNELGISARKSALQHLSLIADYIVSTQDKLLNENRRNTQSLTISIVGILLTIIFSLLSFLATDKYSALHTYLEYLK